MKILDNIFSNSWAFGLVFFLCVGGVFYATHLMFTHLTDTQKAKTEITQTLEKESENITDIQKELNRRGSIIKEFEKRLKDKDERINKLTEKFISLEKHEDGDVCPHIDMNKFCATAEKSNPGWKCPDLLDSYGSIK